MSYAITIIMGNLGRDPEMRYTPDGGAICNFSVAVTEKYKEEEHTEWYNVTVFGKQGESAGKHLKKGSAVLVEGRNRTRKFKDNDGKEQSRTSLIANVWRFAGNKGGQSSSSGDYQMQQTGPASTNTGSGFDDFEDDKPF